MRHCFQRLQGIPSPKQEPMWLVEWWLVCETQHLYLFTKQWLSARWHGFDKVAYPVNFYYPIKLSLAQAWAAWLLVRDMSVHLLQISATVVFSLESIWIMWIVLSLFMAQTKYGSISQILLFILHIFYSYGWIYYFILDSILSWRCGHKV